MEKETLKKLIEIEFDNHKTISQIKKGVIRLIDSYKSDKNHNEIKFNNLKPKPPEPPKDRIFREGENPPVPKSLI